MTRSRNSRRGRRTRRPRSPCGRSCPVCYPPTKRTLLERLRRRTDREKPHERRVFRVDSDQPQHEDDAREYAPPTKNVDTPS